MLFLPTINLWDAATQDAVRSGQIRLQVGQWVQCGPGKKSRFVCVRPCGDIWCVHADGSIDNPTVRRERFTDCVNSWLGRNRQAA